MVEREVAMLEAMMLAAMLHDIIDRRCRESKGELSSMGIGAKPRLFLWSRGKVTFKS